LATPTSGVVDPAAVQLQKNAMWLNFLMIPSNENEKQLVDTAMNHWLPQCTLEKCVLLALAMLLACQGKILNRR
jgi:hypothetical protein